MKKAVIVLDVPDESIATMCSVTYVGEKLEVIQTPCRLIDYEEFLKTEKVKVDFFDNMCYNIIDRICKAQTSKT